MSFCLSPTWHSLGLMLRSRDRCSGMVGLMTIPSLNSIWNAIEETKDMDMCDEDFFVNAAAGEKDAEFIGIAGIPIPKPVDKTSSHMIKIKEFVVKKHNEKAGTMRVFIKVISNVKWIAYTGTFYALLIETQDNKGIYHGKTLVVKARTGHKKLIWYKH